MLFSRLALCSYKIISSSVVCLIFNLLLSVIVLIFVVDNLTGLHKKCLNLVSKKDMFFIIKL